MAINSSSTLDPTIKSYVEENAKDPNAIYQAMQDNAVGFGAIQRAGNWTDQQVDDYVKNSGHAGLLSSYNTYKAGLNKPADPVSTGGTLPAVPQPPGGGTSTTTTPPAQQSFDPNSFAASMQAWTRQLTDSLRPAPAPVTMPAAWSPSQAQLDGISAERRIPGLLTGATAQAAAQQAMGRANARGLLNSSMAVEGANNAMIANAADIAGGDATRFGGLLQTQVNNDAQMQRMGYQSQLNERQSGVDQGYKLDTMGVNMMNDAIKFDANNARADTVYGRDRADFVADRDKNSWDSQRIYERNRADTLVDRATSEARTDALRDDATGVALQAAYTTEVDGIKDGLNREVAAIQQSDLPPDVKQAQVQEATARAQVNVQLTNSLFQNMPKWKTEWSQLTLELDAAPGA